MQYTKGLVIKTARLKKGISLAQLAGIVGKTPSYLCDIERGNRRGTYQTLAKIADALELDVNDIWEVA